MRFRELEYSIDELHQKTKNFLVDSDMISETIHTKAGKKVTVVFGEKEPLVWVNDEKLGNFHYCSTVYSSKDPAWQALSSALRTKVEMARKLNDKLISALIQPFIKEAVLDRLTGAESATNETIIENAFARRLTRLKSIIPDLQTKERIMFPIKSPLENLKLELGWRWGEKAIEISNRDIRSTGLKMKWEIITHYEEMEKIVTEFAKRVTPLLEIVNTGE